MTAEVLVAPGVDDLVATYLRAKLTPVPVTIAVPKTRPAKFVRVLLTGGRGRYDVVLHAAQVTVEAWAASEGEASTLMMLADAHMHAARFQNVGIYNVTAFGAPTNLPDPTSGQRRYTATYEVTVRASAQ